MRTSDKGRELITAAEGVHLRTYVCPAGKHTIGVGHLVKPGESFPDGITMDQAQEMLSHDLAVAERAINTLVTQDVTQAQFDALASFVFNLGVGALGRSTLLKRVNRGDMTGAAAEFGKWVLADGKSMPGLVRRRKAEAVLFRMGNYDVAMRIIRTGV